MANPNSSREQLKKELTGAPPPTSIAMTTPAKVEKVIAEPRKEMKLRHHDMCPGRRSNNITAYECSCEANLVWLAESGVKPLERKRFSFMEKDAKGIESLIEVELWRVDDGRELHTTVPDTTALRRPKAKLVKQPPRWICTRCGWGGRGSDISHRCDYAAVRRASRAASVASMLSHQERTSGAYRLAIWRDGEGLYHLAEEYVMNGQVKELIEIDVDGNYNVIEGALLSASVDGFDP